MGLIPIKITTTTTTSHTTAWPPNTNLSTAGTTLSGD